MNKRQTEVTEIEAGYQPEPDRRETRDGKEELIWTLRLGERRQDYGRRLSEGFELMRLS